MLWRFEDGIGRWQPDSTFAPYQGYYLYSNGGTQLDIPYLDIEAPRPEPEEEQFVEFNAVSGEETVATTRVLFAAFAFTSADFLDQFAPRNAFEPVSIQFLLDEDERWGLYTESRVYMPDGQRLQFKVTNTTTDTAYIELGDINLSFEPGLLVLDRESECNL